MIYFDTEKNAYAQKETIEKWGKTYLTECSEGDYNKLQNGKLMWADDEIVENPNYEEEKKKEKEEKFNQDFFETSLGYVRRKVNMQTGETKSFLFDILPILEVGATIITYKKDGTQNSNVYVTDEFIKECKRQVIIDFYGK